MISWIRKISFLVKNVVKINKYINIYDCRYNYQKFYLNKSSLFHKNCNMDPLDKNVSSFDFSNSKNPILDAFEAAASSLAVNKGIPNSQFHQISNSAPNTKKHCTCERSASSLKRHDISTACHRWFRHRQNTASPQLVLGWVLHGPCWRQKNCAVKKWPVNLCN